MDSSIALVISIVALIVVIGGLLILRNWRIAKIRKNLNRPLTEVPEHIRARHQLTTPSRVRGTDSETDPVKPLAAISLLDTMFEGQIKGVGSLFSQPGPSVPS